MQPITDIEFKKLSGYIKDNYGIHLKEDKLSLITGRLQGVLAQRNCKNFTEYYNYIVSDTTGEAAIELVNKITTNHTFFMRESEHFSCFREEVLPYLKDTVNDRDLRIWSAGCSSGEEPYTLSMIMDEFFDKDKIWWDTKILATDISEKALSKGKKGVYTKDEINSLPAFWKLNYFKKTGDNEYVVIDRIRQEIIFRKLNLVGDSFPFKKKFHVIFCRNVMIYFDNETREKLIRRFYYHMETGAYLFVGLSESISRNITGFKAVSPSVYRKI